MKKTTLFIFSMMFSLSGWAADYSQLLNKITLQLNSQQWITTKTALVSVAVNASVTGQGIEKVQTDVMQKLNQLATGDWHILSFDRQQDKSGLESVQIMAQARLEQSNLGNLRDKAKSVSKPGETFTIDSVQFTPSDAEIQQANISLRNNIYQQAKVELDSLNKIYPDQKYYLYQINFVMQPVMPVANMMIEKVASASAMSPPLAVGNKQELQAMVVFAAMPDVMQKLVHS